ncbi:hypothetical protein OIU77_004692 [Salix suchowensis]|uniref:Uncharacterized protein n=1 Tax=Salix suchowensis TaxID=1278906 RepID=A0ABQ9AWV3_9ROSI|nr:hypothetical protein OIU77_004692 [Salix suchowensis]
MGEFLLQTYGSLDCTYSLFKVLYSVWPYGIRNGFSQGSKPIFSLVFTFPTLFSSPVELLEFPSGQLTMLLLALPLQLSLTTVENSSSSATAQPWCSSASLDDTGNLVLTTAGSINARSSFENPADRQSCPITEFNCKPNFAIRGLPLQASKQWKYEFDMERRCCVLESRIEFCF